MAIEIAVGEAVVLTADAYIEWTAGSGVPTKLSATVSAQATWTTSDAGKVSVSTAGPSRTCTVTGVAAGNATITCTVGVRTASFDYTCVLATAADALYLR